jgi:hypothetical protein
VPAQVDTAPQIEKVWDFLFRHPEEGLDKRTLPRLATSARQRSAQRGVEDLLANIHRSTVCFYPAAHFDWEPLLRLPLGCDTFVFCDWGVGPGEIGVERVPEGYCEPMIEIGGETIQRLAQRPWRTTPLGRPARKFDGLPPWGKFARLARQIDGARRIIDFFYFGIEGVTLFFNLFMPTRVAPRVVCIKEPGTDAWTAFGKWKSHLGLLVDRCHEKPVYLFADGHDWPHTFAVQNIPGGLDRCPGCATMWAITAEAALTCFPASP